LTLPYLSFPTTSSKSLNATSNLAFIGNLQAIKIVSVPVVAVKELLYLTVCLEMLYPGCYQLYTQRFNVTLESAVPFLFTILSMSSELASIVSSSKGMMPQ